MERKKLPQGFDITELFLVKAGNDFKRTFIGQIHRETTKDGRVAIHGSVMVNEGKIWSSAETQEELGENLDAICTLKLKEGLHSTAAKTSEIGGMQYFLN